MYSVTGITGQVGAARVTRPRPPTIPPDVTNGISDTSETHDCITLGMSFSLSITCIPGGL